jgi:hypothetical protein
MRQKLRRRNLPAAERRKRLDQIASQDSFERFVRTLRPTARARESAALKKKGRR